MTPAHVGDMSQKRDGTHLFSRWLRAPRAPVNHSTVSISYWTVFVSCIRFILLMLTNSSWLTFSCALASFCMFSKVYFSDLLWRILKSLDPLLDSSESSSSIMSFGVLCFFPRSIVYSDWWEIAGMKWNNRNRGKKSKYLKQCFQTWQAPIFIFHSKP